MHHLSCMLIITYFMGLHFFSFQLAFSICPIDTVSEGRSKINLVEILLALELILWPIMLLLTLCFLAYDHVSYCVRRDPKPKFISLGIST